MFVAPPQSALIVDDEEGTMLYIDGQYVDGNHSLSAENLARYMVEHRVRHLYQIDLRDGRAPKPLLAFLDAETGYIELPEDFESDVWSGMLARARVVASG
jgi:hypothetical protein